VTEICNWFQSFIAQRSVAATRERKTSRPFATISKHGGSRRRSVVWQSRCAPRPLLSQFPKSIRVSSIDAKTPAAFFAERHNRQIGTILAANRVMSRMKVTFLETAENMKLRFRVSHWSGSCRLTKTLLRRPPGRMSGSATSMVPSRPCPARSRCAAETRCTGDAQACGIRPNVSFLCEGVSVTAYLSRVSGMTLSPFGLQNTKSAWFQWTSGAGPLTTHSNNVLTLFYSLHRRYSS
jgi:hypothetical protein